MIEKQFGTLYGPALKYGEKAACIISLQAEIDQRGGVPYGWMKIYEVLLFGFYNPRTGECFPSHKAIAAKARCSVRSVQRALKWARENNLIVWAHGIVRDGWRVLRTSNRYAFSAFLTIRRILTSIAASNGQKRRGVPTSYKSFTQIAAEARTFRFPTAPCDT
jgi:Helix-turn-helix domain